MQARHIQQLARRAVGLARIEHDLARETHHALHQRRQLGDGHILTHAHIDDAFVLVALHQKQTGIGQIVHMQKLAPRRARAPHHHLRRAARPGLVELADQRRQHMGIGQIEVIPRPVEIGRHQRDGVEAVLAPVGLTQLDAGDLGDRIPLVGGLQRPGEQAILGHRLGRELGVDAGRAQELQLAHPIAPGGIDHRRLDLQVVAQEIRRIAVVGMDAAHLRRRQKHILRPLGGEKRLHRSGIAQVQFGMTTQQQIAKSGLFQPAHNRAAHEAAMTGDENAAVLIHGD